MSLQDNAARKISRKISRKLEPTDEAYARIFQNAPQPMALLRGEVFDEVNLAFESMTGFRHIIGEDCSVLTPKLNDPRSRPFQKMVLQDPGTYEDLVIATEGTFKTVDVTVGTIHHNLALLSFRDRTEKKQLEAQVIERHRDLRQAHQELEQVHVELQATQEMLVQAGKLAALGELTTGVAHEVNQPLLGIRGYAQELQSLVEGDSAQDFLSEIIRGVDKINEIVRHLRTFTAQSLDAFEWVDLKQVIADATKLLRQELEARSIRLDLRIDGEPKVYANAVQLEQVLINLLTNARDAIQSTGRGNGQIEIFCQETEKEISFFVQDNGTGVSEKEKKKLFNPFFTTKEVGQGMGLGLSISYGILKKIHGTIVENGEWGKGACFQVKLPKDFRELG